ncbi:MAG: hypothetical protein R2855_11615 [Thermomicrobiales bacterium]
MVRSNELGCRNGWNADLWVSANTDDGEQRSQPLAAIGGRAAAEVGPAEQNDLITSIVAAKTENAPVSEPRSQRLAEPARITVAEDIIVNQAPALTWAPASNVPVTAQSASELVQDPKAAILRARDQFRQRRRSEGRLADQHLADPSSTYLASSREAQLIHDRDLVLEDPDPDSIDPRYENRALLRPTPSPSIDNGRPVAPVSLREIERSFPTMTDFPEDRARYESVPSVEFESAEDELVDFVQEDTWIETRQVDAVLPEPYVVDDLFEEEELTVEEMLDSHEDVELSVHHRESILNRFLRTRRERRQHERQIGDQMDQENGFAESPPSPIAASSAPQIEDEWELRDSARWTEPVEDGEAEWLLPVQADPVRHVNAAPAAQGIEPHTPAGTRSRYSREPDPWQYTRDNNVRPQHAPIDVDDDFVIPPPLPEIRPEQLQPSQAHDSWRHTRAETRHAERQPVPTVPTKPVADEFGDQPLFAEQPFPVGEDVEIGSQFPRPERPSFTAPRVERICQTCRDFRPSENGERGWCNNKWAFNHRRMVDADDLACRNSLGSWWTPKDEAWRRDGDISRHAQQTPRVDQWLLGTRENDADRRRSGS